MIINASQIDFKDKDQLLFTGVTQVGYVVYKCVAHMRSHETH